MELSRSKMLEIVRKQLSIDMNYDIQCFLNEGIVFCEAKLKSATVNNIRHPIEQAIKKSVL